MKTRSLVRAAQLLSLAMLVILLAGCVTPRGYHRRHDRRDWREDRRDDRRDWREDRRDDRRDRW